MSNLSLHWFSLKTLALNTFRETVRDKIVYNLVFFAIGLIAFSLLLGDWALFAAENVVKDFSLAIMSIFGLMMAIFVGIGLIQKELQRRTVLTLLSQPIPRWHLLVGKYIGLLGVLLVNITVMTACMYFVIWISGGSLQAALLQAVFLLYFEMAVITSVALLFSSFSTPILSALFTIGFYAGGHLSGTVLEHLKFMGEHGDKMPGYEALPDWFAAMIKVATWIIPDLELFNIRGRVVYGLEVGYEVILNAVASGCLYSIVFLALACWWFEKRDFV